MNKRKKWTKFWLRNRFLRITAAQSHETMLTKNVIHFDYRIFFRCFFISVFSVCVRVCFAVGCCRFIVWRLPKRRLPLALWCVAAKGTTKHDKQKCDFKKKSKIKIKTKCKNVNKWAELNRTHGIIGVWHDPRLMYCAIQVAHKRGVDITITFLQSHKIGCRNCDFFLVRII